MGRTHTSRTRRWFAAGPIVTLALSVTACAADDEDSSAATAFDAPAATEAPAEAGMTAGASPQTPAGAGAADLDRLNLGAIGKDVIVEMHVTMTSDDIARSVASIAGNADALGGGIASSDVNYGSSGDPVGAGPGSDGYAVLVVKVPPDQVSRLLDGLEATGVVHSINQSATDVSDQLVDLDVRIANARTSVANVRGFMDATTNLSELVTLEAELTRRQTELEQLEAQQRNLGDRVAMATITVEISATRSVPTAEEDDGLVDALRSGWEAFVAVALGLVYVIAVAAPFLALGAVAAGIWLVVRRRQRTSSAADPRERGTGTDAGTDADTGADKDAGSHHAMTG